MWTDGRFERSGAAVQLFCRVDGSLQPKITWYNEENIQLNDIKKYEVREDLAMHWIKHKRIFLKSFIIRPIQHITFELRSERINVKVLENGDLLIHSAQWEDLGVYTCVATNEYGQDRVSAFFYPTEP